MLLSEDQIQELYEINDDPKRKEFLDELFSFMQKRGTPINRLPIMAKSVLDLYELYNLVIARGGLVEVINKKLWQEIIKGLHLPSSITSAAFTLRTQYMKYLYPFECDKMNLSAPAELQAAIDGNRREGRRSSYGQYEAIHNQIQMPQIARQSLAGSMQQMSPLALVTHAAAANNQQAHAAAAAAAAHHRLIAPTFGQVPNLVTHEIEQRMMEYLKLIQVKKEHTAAAMSGGLVGGNGVSGGSITGIGVGSGNGGGGVPGTVGNSANSLIAAAAAQQQQQQQHQHQLHQQQHQQLQQQQHQQQQQVGRQSSQSPEISTRDALNALEMSRVALWQMYHNNTSPPASVNTSPQLVGGGGNSVVGGVIASADGNATSLNGVEPQREALNLSDSPPHMVSIKREREHEPDEPPTKRAFPASFYYNMAAAAAANFQHAANASHQHMESDAERDDDADADADADADDDGEHNTTGNTSLHDEHEDRKDRLNGHLRHNHNLRHDHHHHHHHHHNMHGTALQQQHHHNDKSDDSAIENSPTTSTSVGNGHISPVSTKKIHLSKLSNVNGATASTISPPSGAAAHSSSAFDEVETLNLLSGLQFRVARSGTSANGEKQLIVNLELNGLKYSGVLTAKAVSRADEALTADDPTADTAAMPTAKTTTATTSSSSPSATAVAATTTALSTSTDVDDSNADKDIELEANEVSTDEVDDESDAEAELTATKMLPKAKTSNMTTDSNGPSNNAATAASLVEAAATATSTATLKDSLITT